MVRIACAVEEIPRTLRYQHEIQGTNDPGICLSRLTSLLRCGGILHSLHGEHQKKMHSQCPYSDYLVQVRHQQQLQLNTFSYTTKYLGFAFCDFRTRSHYSIARRGYVNLTWLCPHLFCLIFFVDEVYGLCILLVGFTTKYGRPINDDGF